MITKAILLKVMGMGNSLVSLMLRCEHFGEPRSTAGPEALRGSQKLAPQGEVV